MDNLEKTDANNAKKKITLFSLLVSIALVIIKVVIAYISNSIGVFSEALNNGLDLVTVLITFFAIRIAARPADKDHTYGHGKYENLSAFIELTIIFLLCSFIIYKSVQRIINRDFILTLNIYIFIILAISIVLNIIRVYFLGKAAKRFNSFALKAEFLNYSSDIFSSIVVIAGLALANYGILLADPIASIVVASIVIFLSLRMSYKVVMNLLDYIPEEITKKINQILANNPDVKKINRLKIHEVGNVKFLNLDICLSENLYLSQIERIKEKLKEEIKSKIPGIEIIIEICSDFSEKDIPAMTRKVLSEFKDIHDVHNIRVYNVGNKKYISAHIEINKNLHLKYVESLTKKVENEIKKQISGIHRVYIHSEDLKSHENWQDVTDESDAMIETIIEEISGIVSPQTCHNFIILKKDDSYNIAFHCRMDKKINIKNAHLLSNTIENLIKNKIENISEVVVHVEPE